MPDAIFGLSDFSQVPKIAQGEDPIYKEQSDICNEFTV